MEQGRNYKSRSCLMIRLLTLAFCLLVLVPTAANAQHEYSPLVEKTVNYKNWNLVGLKDDKPVDLRALVQGKKLVMVVYFAPWCGNWRYEAPVASKLSLALLVRLIPL